MNVVVRAAVFALVALALDACSARDTDSVPVSSSTPYKPDLGTDGRRDGSSKWPGFTRTGARDFSLPPSTELPLERAETPTTNQVYTLPELIDLAQVNNPQTRLAWDQARQSAALVGIARSAFLPMITASVIGGYQRSASGSAVGGAASTGSGMDGNGTVSSASLEYLLFDFGGRDAKLSSARNTLEGSNIGFNGLHQKLIFDVARNFYNYSSAREVVGLSTKARDESAVLLKAAEGRSNQGLETKVEVSQVKSTLAQAELDLVSARGNERDAYNSLIAAIGISPLTALRIQDVSGRPLPPEPPATVRRIVDDALRRRYDIQSGLASLRSANDGVKSAEADFLPKVFMTTSGTYTTGNISISSLPNAPGNSGSTGSSNSAGSGTSLNSRNVTILGGISIPIYDGGVRAASLQSARAKVDSAENTLILLQQNAAKEVVNAYDALRTSVASYRAAGTLVEASTTAKDASLSAYKSGFGSLTSTLDSEKSLQSARTARARAHGTALIAAASLAFSAGRLSSSDAVPAGGLARPTW